MQEKHGRGDCEALKMLDTFASVGVRYFDLTHTNIDQEKRGFRAKQSLEQIRRSMPFLLDSARRRQNNVIVRPHRPAAVLLVQLDDLHADERDEHNPLKRLALVSFLILATSPGNFQAWVAVENPEDATDADFARRLRKGAGADPTASGATRVAGSANFKRKYEPDFPIVAIEAAHPGRIITRGALEALGLVAKPERVNLTMRRNPQHGRAGKWPSYQYCLDHAPAAHGEDRPDVSKADFTWCMTAIDWGFSVEATAARLLEESEKARENGSQYAMNTATNAAAAVQRRHHATIEPV